MPACCSRCLLAAGAAGLIFALPAAAAPSAAQLERAEAIDAAACVPAVRYRSAFSGYRPLSSDPRDWKEANDEVGRIGGWRAYAREAHAPQAAPAGASAPAHGDDRGHGDPGAHRRPDANAPTGDAGHRGHGAHGVGNTK